MSIPALIRASAAKYGLEAGLVACLILQESGGNPYAVRFERRIYRKLEPLMAHELSGYVPEKCHLETEKICRAQSWGLMQALGETARWCAKWKGRYFPELCEPAAGCEVGCHILRFYIDRNQGHMGKGLAAYNAGIATSEEGQQYAGKVLKRFEAKEHLILLGA